MQRANSGQHLADNGLDIRGERESAKMGITDREVYVTIRVPTDPNAWGDECDEELAQRAAELHAERLVAWAREQWPQENVLIGSELVFDTLTNPTEVKTSGADGGHVRDIWSAIEDRAAATWFDALAAAATA